MRLHVWLIKIFFFVLVFEPVFAENQFVSSFQAGVSSFQQKNFTQAAEHFGAALNARPESFAALHNMALIQIELKNYPMALGLLRHALELQPGHVAASAALERVKKTYPIAEMPRDLPFWEQYRNIFLESISLGWYLFLLAVALASSLFFGIRLIQIYKVRRESGQETLGFSIPVALFVIFTILFCVLSVSKYIDQSIQRGTLIASKVALHSAPDVTSPVLIELPAGIYVEVRNQQKEWLQVSYPGSFSGWVQESSVYYPGKRFNNSQKD